MSRGPHWRAHENGSATGDDAGDDWGWRRKIRSNPGAHLFYRTVVGVVGLMVIVVGLILVPFPGPGWLVVLLGLGLWASEFEWARRLLRLARRVVDAWTKGLGLRPRWIKGLVLLVALAAVAGFSWLLLLISGVPDLLPDSVQEWLNRVPGLADWDRVDGRRLASTR